MSPARLAHLASASHARTRRKSASHGHGHGHGHGRWPGGVLVLRRMKGCATRQTDFDRRTHVEPLGWAARAGGSGGGAAGLTVALAAACTVPRILSTLHGRRHVRDASRGPLGGRTYDREVEWRRQKRDAVMKHVARQHAFGGDRRQRCVASWMRTLDAMGHGHRAPTSANTRSAAECGMTRRHRCESLTAASGVADLPRLWRQRVGVTRQWTVRPAACAAEHASGATQPLVPRSRFIALSMEPPAARSGLTLTTHVNRNPRLDSIARHRTSRQRTARPQLSMSDVIDTQCDNGEAHHLERRNGDVWYQYTEDVEIGLVCYGTYSPRSCGVSCPGAIGDTSTATCGAPSFTPDFIGPAHRTHATRWKLCAGLVRPLAFSARRSPAACLSMPHEELPAWVAVPDDDEASSIRTEASSIFLDVVAGTTMVMLQRCCSWAGQSLHLGGSSRSRPLRRTPACAAWCSGTRTTPPRKPQSSRKRR